MTLDTAVAALIAQVADTAILPRFRALAAADVEEKTPGDRVTIADREAEALLTAGLVRIDPTARVIGEEAFAADPSILDGIARDRVWIVDPLDGTNNFADGITPFGIIVALAQGGVTQRGWLYDPVTRRLAHAIRGQGAYIDGERVHACPTGARLPITTFASYWLAPDQKRRIEAAAAGKLDLRTGLRCAAAQYPAIVTGTHDLARFERVFPWDHAAGALFVEEAGGRVGKPDGSDYRLEDLSPGLLVAASPALWDAGAEILFA